MDACATAANRIFQSLAWRALCLLLLLLPAPTLADTAPTEQQWTEWQRQWDEAFEREERQRLPVLQQPRHLAGMAMPAGTRLELLHKNAVGAAAVKPEYFERAHFPQAVMWRGLPLKSMHRRLESVHCFEKHDFDFERCASLPAEERATTIQWGLYVDVELAAPARIEGFYCQGSVAWRWPEPEEKPGVLAVPSVSAALPAPDAYQFVGCRAAADNEFRSANGFLHFKLPENTQLFSNRQLDASLPKGYRDIWTINEIGGRSDEILPGNLFSFKVQNWSLNPQHELYGLAGEIVAGTAACPLAPGTFVQWDARRADTLSIHGSAPVLQCGSFPHIELLTQRPPYLEFLDLEVPPPQP